MAPEVVAVIKRGRVFSGGRRHHELVAQLLPEGAAWVDITVPLDGVFAQYALLSSSDPALEIIVFASGDPLFFGFANTIRRKMPEAEVAVYPSFNSLQTLAHRLLLPYHDMRVVSLTGRPWPAFDRALIERSTMIGVLTDHLHTPAAIAQRMMDYGYVDYTMHVGERLGSDSGECLLTLTLEEAAQRTFAHPNCLILEACRPLAPRPFGIADTAFALLDGREKMITKMPIRLLTLQALELAQHSVLWDIGFCTGSVSVEARLSFPDVRITAFEVRRECEAIIRENMRRHGAPGIDVVMGDFLDVFRAEGTTDAVCAAYGRPDAVFIGGHGGQLAAILRRVASVMPKGGVIVMNSVTSAVVEEATGHRPSSRQLWDDACRELGLTQEPSLRIQLNDYNPIEILKCRT